MFITNPAEVANKDAVLSVGFSGVYGAPSEATHALRGSLTVNPSLHHTSLLLGVVTSRG